MGGQRVSPVVQRAILTFATTDQSFIIDAIQETDEARRQTLVDALAKYNIAAWGESGSHVWIPVPEEYPVAQSLRDGGWAVTPGERFRIRSGPGIRIVTASLPENQAASLADDLSAILG